MSKILRTSATFKSLKFDKKLSIIIERNVNNIYIFFNYNKFMYYSYINSRISSKLKAIK